ncbi:MAG: FAD-dependent oxidoreductase [Patescibacteria group bacterium]
MKLTLVKKMDEAKDTKSFFFTANEKLSWQAGQYLYLTLDGITKQFTIASSPTEKFIQVTTRIRKESKFKKLLNKLQIGSTIKARGPFGSFVFPIINSSLLTINCFIAGGIGITPFRAMIKNIIDNKIKKDIYLIYSNSDNEFVFKKDLDKWKKENNFIKIDYIDTSVSGHLDKNSLNHYISDHSISSVFWVVGPPPFVNAMEDILEKFRIPEDHVRTEKFIGY